MEQPARFANEEPRPAGPAPSAEADEATRGSAIKLAAEAAGRVFGLATTLLVARGLGVPDFGVFAALSGIAVIAAEAGDLGLQVTASRALVAGTMSLGALLRARLALTVLVAALALALAALSPLLTPLVLYFALANWSEFLGVALRARGRRLEEAGVIVALRVAGLVLVAAGLARGGGLSDVAWALALSPVPAIVLGGALAVRTYGGASAGGGSGAQASVPAVLRASVPLALNGALALLSLRIEVLLLAALRGSREAGLFAAALKVLEFLNMVPSAVSAGAMPALTREGMRGAGPVRQRTAGTVALFAVPAAAGLYLVAPDLVVRLFGAGFEAAAAPLRVLAAALVVLFMNTVLLHSLIAVGRAETLPRLTGLRVGAAVVLALVLIPALGGLGAAAGFLAAELGLLLLASRACVAARFDVPLARPLAVAAGVSLPMAAAVGLAGGGLIGSIALGVVTYLATLAGAWRVAPWLLHGSRIDVRYS